MPQRPLPLSATPGAAAPARGAGERRSVLLVCPPFQHLTLASLSVPLLATVLRREGIACEEAHLQFELARRLGPERYGRITTGSRGLVAELLFAEGLHGPPSDAALAAELEELVGPPAERERLRAALAAAFLARVEAARPELVGFTTSLNQLLAALFLARVLKARAPAVRIVLGGSACAAPMGGVLLAAYPDVDWVVSGWGEPALLALARGEAPPARLIESHAPIELDAAPVPDFGPFLRDAGEFAEDPRLLLTFEASRGCWWGMKHHCAFCGLNGVELAFTRKSSARVLREIRGLFGAHRRGLFATDTILAIEHLRHVIPALAADTDGPRLFFEVKANLTEADVRALRRARVVGIQPGIESLSTPLLGHLRKGIDAIRNVALLKWCREQGIAVAWNQLCGIPSETAEDYASQLALMERIPHLPPPDAVNPVHIDRFSPYFERYRDYGWERLEPLPEYRALHPTLDAAALTDVAYHFRGLGGPSPEPYLARFTAAVDEWRRRNRRGDGLFLDAQHGLYRNEGGTTARFELSAGLARLLELTHQVAPVARVVEQAGCHPRVIDKLVAAGILLVEGARVVNLVVRRPRPE